ncbi:MAG: helicase, partial [Candidatus Gastranaerophilales bacterium]|nr:helicase [Candidatus Gastranaerophilales bacterium]
IELYDKFFKAAFPRLVERLGIVYTPVKVVDFIIYSANYALQKEFGRSLSDENVHILDPFTGTGTFITRLLQSGVIGPDDLEYKYTHELHANEIVLLAYYIASVNIENVYHDIRGEAEGEYTPFNGICLTDTFQLGETSGGEVLFSEMFPQNSKRVQEQQKAPVRVIIGNPPYSIGQKSANDNAQNLSYPRLEKRVMDTYVAKSEAGLNKSLYDAYIKAFRWASDRLDPKNGGIICYVSNGAWIDGNSTDGFRKTIEKEFSSIYVFNLRGNQRTSGELSRREGGKIFGSGSRTPIAVTLLIKKPQQTGKANIYYYEVEDYLTREEKLELTSHFGSIKSVPWKSIKPNEHGDWVNKRNEGFAEFLPLAPEKKFDMKTHSFFTTYSLGVATNKDAYMYNSSKIVLENTIQNMIDFYNEERIKANSIDTYEIKYDATKIVWTDMFIKSLNNNEEFTLNINQFTTSLYRPFFKQVFCYQKELIQRTYQQTKLFPLPDSDNLVICLSGIGASKDFSVLISDTIPDLQLIFNGQCFPLYWYDEHKQDSPTLFDSMADPTPSSYIRRDGISDFILERARSMYGNKTTKEDVFYYVYGILHSPKYRETYAADLKKMLPRLPL